VRFSFDAQLWVWAARRDDSWVFVTLPTDASAEIRERTGGTRRGFGSVRVHAAVGGSAWRTSVFPDAGTGCYVLPLKKAVRHAEGLEAGDVATVTVEVLDR
jgi:hypothetical protein